MRKYGCPGCHDIPGMESESRIGAELSAYGSKSKEELFFGDRIDLEETWDDFTFHKIKEPRGYATKWIEQVMPQFDLADEDIYALRVFLTSRTEQEGAGAVHATSGRWAARDRRRAAGSSRATTAPVATSSRARGGNIRRLYEDNLHAGAADPARRGRRRCSSRLALQLPAGADARSVRGCKVRMPTFDLTPRRPRRSSSYFATLDHARGAVRPHRHARCCARATSQAGEQLASKDYLSCFSCHVHGTTESRGFARQLGAEPRDGGAHA